MGCHQMLTQWLNSCRTSINQDQTSQVEIKRLRNNLHLTYPIPTHTSPVPATHQKNWLMFTIEFHNREGEGTKTAVRGTQTNHTPSTTSGHQQHAKDILNQSKHHLHAINTQTRSTMCNRSRHPKPPSPHPLPLHFSKFKQSAVQFLVNILLYLQFCNSWLVHSRSVKGCLLLQWKC